jgi:hypothetical protein
MDDAAWAGIAEKLAAPFGDVQWVIVSEGKGDSKNDLWAPFLDKRQVQDRLDEVVGPGGWGFAVEAIPGDPNCLIGRLTVLGVTKSDVGDGKGTDTPLKSAASDALKRCAVHFGIGRHLGGQRWIAKGQKPPPILAGEKKKAYAPPPGKIDTLEPSVSPKSRQRSSGTKAASPPASQSDAALPVNPERPPWQDDDIPTWASRLRDLQVKNKLTLDEIIEMLHIERLVPGDPAASFRKHVATQAAKKEWEHEEIYRIMYRDLEIELDKKEK